MIEVSEILQTLSDWSDTADINTSTMLMCASLPSFLSNIKSSYKKHNYWIKFYNWVRDKKPDLIVEMGILQGYSLLSFAKSCADHKTGKVIAIDLFDDYPYSKANYDDIKTKLQTLGLDKHVYLHKGDALNLDLQFDDNSIDILHIDISNTGDKIEYLLKKYHCKLKPTGIVVFEGGSKSRDNIPWMVNYNCVPIAPIIEKPELQKLYNFFVIENYPSLTICYKKYEQC